MPSFFNEEGCKLFGDLELEADDVVLVSFPKAGTTWVNKIIHCLLRMDESGVLPAINGDLGASGQVYPDWLPAQKPADPSWPGIGPGGLFGKVDFADLCAQPRPRLFTTHLPAELLPRSLARTGRLVYVLRNPKDCLNSLHFFRGEAKDGWLGNEHGPGSLERFLTGVNAYGSFFDHVLSLSGFIEGLAADRVLVIYYEDLRSDHSAGVQQLDDFLKVPLPEAKLQAVCAATSFKAMSSGSAGKEVSAMLCRKGICGDWQGAPLSREQWARMDRAFEAHLGSCPLAQPMQRWLTWEEGDGGAVDEQRG